MNDYLDLLEHEGYVRTLIKRWKVEEQDWDDVFQEFYLYFSRSKYDPEKGKPTTFISAVFFNFMSDYIRPTSKKPPKENMINTESRDKEFLDREQGGYEMSTDDEIYIGELLKDVDPLTFSILLGDVTLSEQARKEGISKQAIHQRHQRRMKEILGE